ncbi:hypothetical protein Tco_0498879 [Tanacetum coccineum]
MIDFNKPLKKQDTLNELNDLANKKRKRTGDSTDHSRSTKKHKSSIQHEEEVLRRLGSIFTSVYAAVQKLKKAFDSKGPTRGSQVAVSIDLNDSEELLCQVDQRMKKATGKGDAYATRVNLVEVDVTCDGSPKVSNSSPLVSPSTTINVPQELYNINVAATFGVPLTTVRDLHKLINDIEAGKHDELLFVITNDDRIETMDTLGTICSSIRADNNNADAIPCKVSHVDNSINLNVNESTIPSDPIIQSMDINTKLTSYAGAAGASAKDQPKVNSNFRTLVANPVFDGVNISIPRKVVEKVVSPPIVTTSNVVTPTVEKTNDGFRTVGKKKKRKDKSKSTNGGQFAGPLVKQNVRYEPKATTSAPKKGVTNVGNTSQSSFMLKTTDISSKKDYLSMFNSFSALNDEEDVENVYDESANLKKTQKLVEVHLARLLLVSLFS